MKVYMLLGAFVFFAICASAQAEEVGDVNGDGLVGLPQAVHALQVSAGIRSPYVVATYDLADYFKPLGEFFYDEVNSSNQKGTMLLKRYLDGGLLIDEIVTGESSGYKYYYEIDASKVCGVGVFSPNTGEYVGYNPAYAIGSRSMKVDDTFYNFYRSGEGNLYTYREYIFLGFENVTVPAGTFEGCMKILRKYTSGSFYHPAVLYYAKGVGSVKEIYAGSSTRELSFARVGDTVYPAGGKVCLGQGTWDLGGVSLEDNAFRLSFNSNSSPIISNLSLTFLGGKAYRRYYVISQDGINFSINQDAYIDQSPPPSINFSLEYGQIAGISPSDIMLAVTYSCRDQLAP